MFCSRTLHSNWDVTFTNEELQKFEQFSRGLRVLNYWPMRPRFYGIIRGTSPLSNTFIKKLKKTLLPIKYSESDSCIFEKLKRNCIFKQFKSIWKRKFPNDIDKQDCLSKHRIQLFKTYMLSESTALHLQSLNPKWNELIKANQNVLLIDLIA